MQIAGGLSTNCRKTALLSTIASLGSAACSSISLTILATCRLWKARRGVTTPVDAVAHVDIMAPGRCTD